jgi:kumamolisin
VRRQSLVLRRLRLDRVGPGIGATRGVPDVAADASGTTGMALTFSAPGGSYELIGAGGTSAAAPFWAGLIALADQQGHCP